MFCAKCGKQIEDDSTFCPFCGQQVDAPVVDKRSVISAKTMIKDGVKKSSALQGILSNKKIWGTALALAAVVAIGIGGVKLLGGLSNRMKSVPEKLFDMSWDEFSKTSLDDMKDMLDDADIFYADDFSVPGFETTTAEPFFEGESIFWHGVSMPPEFAFAVGFKSIDEFKDFKDSLENYLDKRIIKNAAVMSDNGSRSSAIYPIEVSTKNLEYYIDAYAEYAAYTGITDSANTNTIDLEGEAYAVYKFVSVEYTQESLESYAEEASFWLDEEYIQRCCLIDVTYRLMKEEDFIMMQAQCGHDAISGKELDLDKFKSSVDEKVVREYLNKKVRENPESREDLEKDFYTKLYMMEKHDLDMGTRSYLKTKEEKKLWYIRNFGWDTDTQSMLDFSEYRNSSDIYCAVEFNYDSSKAEYFESELDKALYLVDRNYKLETGEYFESEEEKRLWFMGNYSYDTSSGKMIDKEIVDALIAYQNYVPTLPYIEEEKYVRYTLVYLNDDEVPECLVWSHSYNPDPTIHGAVYVLSYNNGTVQMFDPESPYQFDVSVSYTPKEGKFCTDTVLGLRSAEDWVVAELGDDFSKIGTAWRDNDWETYYNVLNDSNVQAEDIDAYIDSFDFEIELDSTEAKGTILAAYDALRTTEYQILAYEFTEFNLSDGILTFSSDGADRYGKEDAKSFSYSFPVAENCTWGYYRAGENYPYEESDYEDMKDLIESDMESYAKDFENYGDIGYWDSPASYYIIVTDNEVVDVRVVYS